MSQCKNYNKTKEDYCQRQSSKKNKLDLCTFHFNQYEKALLAETTYKKSLVQHEKEFNRKDFKIKKLSNDAMLEILDGQNLRTYKYKPLGLYYVKENDGTFSAFDNSTGDCWAENFKTLKRAKAWLKGKFEVK